MNKIITDIERAMDSSVVSLDNIDTLEDIVTPGSGFGCNC